MNALFALFSGPMAAWGIIDFIVAIIIICAVVGIAWIVCREVFGVVPPPWLIKIAWIVIACVVAIVAIRFIAGL